MPTPDPKLTKARRFRPLSYLSIVPHPVVVYAVLSLLDYGFSLIAFQLGYAEGNPFLAFMKNNGLFEATKIGTIIVVILIGVFLWRLKVVRFILGVAVFFMFLLFCFHLFAMIRYLAYH